MDQRSVFVTQLETLSAYLDRAQQAMKVKQINADLSQTVQSIFAKQFNEQQKLLSNLQQDAPGKKLDECWKEYRAIHQKCAPLLRECLAFLQGALVRSAQLDRGICNLADALLNYLTRKTDIRWARLTIPGEGEFFHQVSGIIRLRFTEFSIWTLPVAAHEFGHLVAQEMKVRGDDGQYRSPVTDILAREKKAHSEGKFLGELFGDLFGIYVVGPALACCNILSIFDPGEADLDKTLHPSYAKRAHFMLETLKKMDQEEGLLMRPFNDTINRLEKLWHDSLVEVGQPTSIKAASLERLGGWLDELYQLLLGEMPDARYRDWSRAGEIASDLMSQKKPAQIARDGDTLPAVFNAAWQCRIRNWDQGSFQMGQLSSRAVDVCHEIIQRAA